MSNTSTQSYLVNDKRGWYTFDKSPALPPPPGWRRIIAARSQWAAMRESRCYCYYGWLFN